MSRSNLENTPPPPAKTDTYDPGQGSNPNRKKGIIDPMMKVMRNEKGVKKSGAGSTRMHERGCNLC